MHEKMKVGSLNHLAIKTASVLRLSSFYTSVLGMEQVKQHHDENGLRAVWLRLGEGLLMIERSKLRGQENLPSSKQYEHDPPGIHLLAFKIEEASKTSWRQKLQENQIRIESESDFTIYFFDPDGNRIGLSSYEDESITS